MSFPNFETPEALEAFLDMLVQGGVEEFEGFGLHVRFTAAMFTPDRVMKDAESPVEVMEERKEPDSIWKEPKLWPGGKPTEFK